MRELFVLLAYFLSTLVKLCKPGGALHGGRGIAEHGCGANIDGFILLENVVPGPKVLPRSHCGNG